MSPGSYTVVTPDDTYSLPVSGSITVADALAAAFPSGGFSWDTHTVRLGNAGVSESNARTTQVSEGQTLTVLGSGLASAGIKGN